MKSFELFSHIYLSKYWEDILPLYIEIIIIYYDIFIGRIVVSNTIDDFKVYIEDNFRINVINISQITVRYNHYNCYKFQILLSDRNCLFNANMWLEGVVINRFYNRMN